MTRFGFVLAALLAVLMSATQVTAATTVVVTPANPQGWDRADTRTGGNVNFVADSTGQVGNGALQLTTDATNDAKAQYVHGAETALADINELSYYTKQNSASFPEGAPSYQLAVCLGGFDGTTCTGFTTLVFEPYQNGAVVPGTWQSWDVAAGQLWSSRSFTDSGACTVVSGAGGAPFYTLAELQAACPNAVVAGFGVNVGTFNPSYDVETDLVDFNGTIYDFELNNVATSKDDCKNGGYHNVTRADGSAFNNQGDCIQYFNTGK